MLEQVKNMLGITGSFQDSIIEGYIKEVKQYLLDAGVPQSIVDDDKAIGTIARGVEDLWTANAGEAKFSNYFNQRVIQLRSQRLLDEDEDKDEEVIDDEEL